MMTVLPVLAFAAAAFGDADEPLYLTSHFNVDGVASTGSADGSFDGNLAFPAIALGDERTIDVVSARFGNLRFVKPPLKDGAKNLIAARRQTIDVRSSKTFSVVLFLGASRRKVSDGLFDPSRDDRGHALGDVVLGFTDGSTRSEPFALSDWLGPPVFGEDIAIEASLSPHPDGSDDDAFGGIELLDARDDDGYVSGRLFVQHLRIPTGKSLKSITLPDRPEIQIAAITLAERDGARPVDRTPSEPPAPAPVALFAEPGFPVSDGFLTIGAPGLRSALAALGIEAAILGARELADPAILTVERYPVLVLTESSGIPREAIAALAEYRRAGGAIVQNGYPLLLPVDRGPGAWVQRSAFETSARTGNPFGMPPVASITATRLSATAALGAWGFPAELWASLDTPSWIVGIPEELGDAGFGSASYEIEPLLRVGSWSQAAAAIVRYRGELDGAIDILLLGPSPSSGGESDAALATAVATRAVAYVLHAKGRIDDERWSAIASPYEAKPVVKAPVPELIDDPWAALAAKKPEGTLRWIDATALSVHDKVLIASAQGLIHQRGEHALWIRDGASASQKARNDLERELLLAQGGFEKEQRATVNDVLELVGHRRAVVVDPDTPGSLNIATMVAAVEGVLIAYPGFVVGRRLEVALDLRELFDDYAESIRWARENLAPRLDPALTVLLPDTPESWRVRDLAIARRLFCLTATDTSSGVSAFRASPRAALDEIEATLAARRTLGGLLSWDGDESNLGYGANAGVATAWSIRYGKLPLEFFAAENLSLTATLPKPALRAVEEPRALKPEKDKIFLCVFGSAIDRHTLARVGIVLAQKRMLEKAGAEFPGGLDLDAEAIAAKTGYMREHPLAVELSSTELDPFRTRAVLELLESPSIGGLTFSPLAAFSARRGGRATFGGAYSGGGAALDTKLGEFVRREMERVGAHYLVWPRGLELSEAIAGALPEGSVVARGTLPSAGGASYRGNRSLTSGIAGDSIDLLSAQTFVGDVPVLTLIDAGSLFELLRGGIEVYRPLFPVVLATDATSYELLTSPRFAGALSRSGDEKPFTMPADVVVVRPNEVAPLLAQLGERAAIRSETIVAGGSRWKYDDSGEDRGTRWRLPGFDDSAWSEGPAELGYGDAAEGRPEATVLRFGADARSKHPCYYFRHRFRLEKKPGWRLLVLEAMVDDGCVVYVNGKEQQRYNMPEGEIAYPTMAGGAYAGDEFESKWVAKPLSASAFVDGENTIAVEVHQGSRASSDLSFDLRLTAYRRE